MGYGEVMNEQSPHTELLLELLQSNPEGLSEYELLLRLNRRHGLPETLTSDTLELFRTHFLLFHTLYQLRDRLHAEGTALLEISPLCIRLLAYRAGEGAVSEADPLRAYYLNLDHLRETGAEDVQRMLGQFWLRLQGGEERQMALELFELSSETDLNLNVIRQRYRQLVSVHHPDRGGSTQQLQAINNAMETLQRHYR